ncbi:hypothetical protein [Thiothrix subterranea]
MDNNLPADGYATLQHLNALRQRVAEKTAN